MKMKVGIDAKWYFEGPPSGKMVVRNLVNELLTNSHDHNIFLFLDTKYKHVPLEIDSSRVTKIYLWAENNLFANMFLIPFVARKHKVDVFVFQNFVSLFGSFKKVAYIHDIIFLTHPQFYTFWERLYFKPLKSLTKLSDYVVTVSYAEKKRIANHSYTNKEVGVVYHGVENCFRPKVLQPSELLAIVQQKYNLPEHFVLYVGRLNSRKNVPNLLRAYALLENKEVPLVLVGGYDWKTENLEPLIDELGIRNRLLFTGPVFGDELGAIYSLATLFCFPSYEESFGLPPLEAMAAGIPVVVSNSSSIPEICGEAGNYVDSDNPVSIANQI
ncbi:glycosyltransferase family 4 protein, partial [Nostoc sp. CHAB 5834]|nr:glycosyltransferase family 4 protein [Nostoc sp. CHAB 5834]